MGIITHALALLFRHFDKLGFRLGHNRYSFFQPLIYIQMQIYRSDRTFFNNDLHRKYLQWKMCVFKVVEYIRDEFNCSDIHQLSSASCSLCIGRITFMPRWMSEKPIRGIRQNLFVCVSFKSLQFTGCRIEKKLQISVKVGFLVIVFFFLLFFFLFLFFFFAMLRVYAVHGHCVFQQTDN